MVTTEIGLSIIAQLHELRHESEFRLPPEIGEFLGDLIKATIDVNVSENSMSQPGLPDKYREPHPEIRRGGVPSRTVRRCMTLLAPRRWRCAPGPSQASSYGLWAEALRALLALRPAGTNSCSGFPTSLYQSQVRFTFQQKPSVNFPYSNHRAIPQRRRSSGSIWNLKRHYLFQEKLGLSGSE